MAKRAWVGCRIEVPGYISSVIGEFATLISLYWLLLTIFVTSIETIIMRPTTGVRGWSPQLGARLLRGARGLLGRMYTTRLG